MKKILLASTMLAAFATVAEAETGVTISGYGRIGLQYLNDGTDSGTFVHTRLRFNIDATTETDSGVKFGGRIRIQQSAGLDDYFSAYGNSNDTTISPAMLYVEYEGLRVEAGNVNTAFDSAALLYDSELGLTDSSFGDSRSSYYSFSTGGYHSGRTGVYASYSMSGFTGQISYVDSEHYHPGVASNAETSIALAYSNDMFTVSAAAVQNGGGSTNDAWFIGGAYKLSDVATVGLNYLSETNDSTTVVLYGNYKMDAVTVKGYIASNDTVGNADDIAIGIGADYDLGGAKLTGGIQRGYNDNTLVDVGVRFNF